MATSLIQTASEVQNQAGTASQLEPQPASVSVLSLSRNVVPTQRLVVLVSNLDSDEVEVARQIWEMAAPPHLAVLFLALCTDIREEPGMRRRLATLAALTRDDRVPVETRLSFGRDWIREVRNILADGDVVVCPAEQQTGLRHKPLNQALAVTGAPIWTLDGLYRAGSAARRNPLAEVLFWFVSIIIMLAFWWLQVKIVNLPKDWAHTTLLGASVLVEIILLYFWHRFSQQS